MNVLILYPELESFRQKSLGVSILAGIIKEEGHNVLLFETSMYDQTKILPDQSIKHKEKTILYWFKTGKTKLPSMDTLDIDVADAFEKKLDEFQPTVILVSSSYLSYPLGVNLINQSNNAKMCKVIYGGVHCTVTPDDAINQNNVEYMHVGEAEKSLPEILRRIDNNEPIDDCPNLWVKTENSGIKKNDKLSLLKDLDEMPYYDWDIYSDYHFVRLYEGNVYRVGDYSTSRGCVKKCTYCFNRQLFSAYGQKVHFIRKYTIPRVIKELEYLKDRYKLTFIKFHDSDFLNKSNKYLDEFSALYKEKINLPNTLNACVEHISEKKAQYLVRMNCRSVSIGLESGNENVREKVLNRHYSNDVFIEKVSVLKKLGIRVCVPCMIGLPDETKENIIETIRVCKKAGVDHADFGIFFPFPNMSLTNYAINKGYIEKDQPLYHLIFGVESALNSNYFTHEELRNILRCSMLYFRLPYFLWPLIKFAEKHNTDNGLTWLFLRKTYFMLLDFFDFQGKKREIKRVKASKLLSFAE